MLNTMVLDSVQRTSTASPAMNAEHGLSPAAPESRRAGHGLPRAPARRAGTSPATRRAGIYTAGTAQQLVNMEGYHARPASVVILGSGDIGLIMARRMTLEGAKVLGCVELMPYSGGLKRNIVQCLDDYGIPLKLSHTVVDIQGKERVERHHRWRRWTKTASPSPAPREPLRLRHAAALRAV